MNNPQCPFCDKKQLEKPLKSWQYGKMIKKRIKGGKIEWGATINVERYACKCGKFFNQCISTKGKSWTIPKRETALKRMAKQNSLT